MLKHSQYSKCIALLCLLFFINQSLAVKCSGRFPNPVTDVCWQCLFPIHIGSMEVSGTDQKDNGDPKPPLICACPAPPPIFVRPGIGVSFWEPARIAEVVRTPMCSPTLNGQVLGSIPAPNGVHFTGDSETQEAFYQVHWFQYPVLSWLGMGLAQLCFVSEPFDLTYLTELDPLWNDDELTFLLNPEAILFANIPAQAACAADAAKASYTGFGIDSLFWCAGAQGSVYPLTGNILYHESSIASSLLLVHRHIFKMHRQLLAQDTSTLAAMCGNLPQPILRKKQYKQQMMYPIPQTKKGLGLGASSIIWGTGKEFPYKGEDFTYLIWRKRTCCAL